MDSLAHALQKEISLCHRYRARPVCTSMQFDHAGFILVTDQLQILSDIPKNDKCTGRRTSPFTNFSRLNVQNLSTCVLNDILT